MQKATAHTARQAGAIIFDEKYAEWTPRDLIVPNGLTRKRIDDAASLVFAWQNSSEPYAIPLVLEIWALLAAD